MIFFLLRNAFKNAKFDLHGSENMPVGKCGCE